VGTKVVVADDEGLQGPIELGERELRRCGGPAVHKVARQRGQEQLVHGREKSLDFAPALWLTSRAVDELGVQVRADLVHVAAREVAAVVRIQNRRDAADMPGGIGLAPDRLAESKGSLQD
jgi:hypothetical protein